MSGIHGQKELSAQKQKKKNDGQDNESEDEAIGSVNETIPNGIHMVGVAHITVFDSSFLLWE